MKYIQNLLIGKSFILTFSLLNQCILLLALFLLFEKRGYCRVTVTFFEHLFDVSLGFSGEDILDEAQLMGV